MRRLHTHGRTINYDIFYNRNSFAEYRIDNNNIKNIIIYSIIDTSLHLRSIYFPLQLYHYTRTPAWASYCSTRCDLYAHTYSNILLFIIITYIGTIICGINGAIFLYCNNGWMGPKIKSCAHCSAAAFCLLAVVLWRSYCAPYTEVETKNYSSDAHLKGFVIRPPIMYNNNT